MFQGLALELTLELTWSFRGLTLEIVNVKGVVKKGERGERERDLRDRLIG